MQSLRAKVQTSEHFHRKSGMCMNAERMVKPEVTLDADWPRQQVQASENTDQKWDWLMTRIPAEPFGNYKRLRCHLGAAGLIVALISAALFQVIDILRSLR